jgi:hypothetical protein
MRVPWIWSVLVEQQFSRRETAAVRDVHQRARLCEEWIYTVRPRGMRVSGANLRTKCHGRPVIEADLGCGRMKPLRLTVEASEHRTVRFPA